MNKLATVVAIAFVVLLGAGGAEAVTETWSFNLPPGPQGTERTYLGSPGGDPLILHAFLSMSNGNAPFTDGFLYGKNDGPGETGVGVCSTADGSSCGDHEITTSEYIRVDFDSLGLTGVLFKIGSLQTGESFQIYTSNTATSFNGTAVCASGTGGLEQTVSCSGLARYAFIRASSSDVVLETISGNTPVPEPATMFLAGIGLILLGYGARRRLFGR